MIDKKQVKVDIKKLQKELEIFKKKAEENLAGWQRAKADYENFKKRQAQRMQEIIKFANEGLILEILPILDNFELAFKEIPKGQEKTSWVHGMMHIKSQFESLLKEKGVEEIEAIGEEFNPELHEAVAHESSIMNHESWKIEEVVQKGYMLNGKVIRVAKVKIPNSK